MPLAQKYFAEGIGTFLLIFTIGVSQGDIFSVGPIFWLGMVITRFVSGAFFNPAVTLSIALKQLFEHSFELKHLKLYLVYTLVQFLSGITGALLAWYLTNQSLYLDLPPDYSIYKACLCEAVFTCILCLNAHMLNKSRYGLYMEALIVALTVMTGIKTVAHLSGSALNPCVGVSLNIIHFFVHGKGFAHVWIYLVGPMIGSVVAAVISQFNRDLREKHGKVFRKSSLTFTLLSKDVENNNL